MLYPSVKTLNICKAISKEDAVDESEKAAHSVAEQVAAQAWTSTFSSPSVVSPQTLKPSLVNQFYTQYNQAHAFSSIPANPFNLGIFQNVTRSHLSINLIPTITFSLTTSETHFTQSYAHDTQYTQNSNNYKLSGIVNASSNKSLRQISFHVGKLLNPAPSDTQMSTAISFQNTDFSTSILRHSSRACIGNGRIQLPPSNTLRPYIYKILLSVYESNQSAFPILFPSQFAQPGSIITHEDIQSLSCVNYNQTPYIPECFNNDKLECIGNQTWLSSIYALTVRQVPAVNVFQGIQSLSRMNETCSDQIDYKAASDYLFKLIRAYINQEHSHSSRVSNVEKHFTLSIKAEFFQNSSEHIPNIALSQIGISINLPRYPTLNLSQLIQFLFRCSQSFIHHDRLCIDSALHSDYTLPPQFITTYSLHIYTFEYHGYNSNLLHDTNFNSTPRLLLNECTSTNNNSESVIQNLISEPYTPYTHATISNSSNTKPSVQKSVPEPFVSYISNPNLKLPKLISVLNHGSDRPIVSTTLECAYGEFI